ncbi:hypothetical protein LJR153_005974 [Paenibacillus sp. LjRoot153]|uniref:YncE family protein n=1 Tax=Paenibacillus sp. LjRoot153 TaxID=3342270 RepID=UPI003ED03A4E
MSIKQYPASEKLIYWSNNAINNNETWATATNLGDDKIIRITTSYPDKTMMTTKGIGIGFRKEEVGRNPIAASLNPRTNRFYVSNADSGTVSVINSFTNRVVSTVQLPFGGGNIIVNPRTNRIYAISKQPDDHAVLAVIDGMKNRILETVDLFGTNPVGMAVNTLTNRTVFLLILPISEI